jgi:hypothetical protein
MPSKFVTADIGKVVADKTRPGVTSWNRLEGRPRTERFDRALRAEVRDAMWMLSKQWQMGEFQGDDAGSPIFAKVRVDATRIRSYRAGAGPTESFDDGTPLEARVERMPVPLTLDGQPMALDLRLMLGRYWLKLIDTLEPTARPAFVAKYPIHAPGGAGLADAATVAHPEAWSLSAAATSGGRAMDGVLLYQHLVAGGHAADGIAVLAGRQTEAATLGRRFVAWFDRLISQPPANAAWQPDRLEYQFACAAPDAAGGSPAGKVMVADEYFHGHLDWYNLDVDPSGDALPPPDAGPPDGGAPVGSDPARTSRTLSMLPTQLSFNGMPNTRWWEFEDGRTNFGDIRPDTTDLGKLLLIEFGLVYANDWYLVPFTVPAGSIANVRGMAVTNVFDERIWIEAAGRGDDDDWQRWAMFLLSTKGTGHQPADTSLVLLPAAQQVLESRPLEAIALARDEMANMVWAVERTIALPSGSPKPGAEAAAETRAFFLRDFEQRHGHRPEPPPGAPGATIRYQVMSEVPEHWIPMIPVHVAGDARETQLQRAAMLRFLDGDTAGGIPVDPAPIRPRTSLLRVGLDGPGPPERYVLHEEEVPRAGVRVTQAFQRTRWRDGRAWVWLGVRKQTGRGEGSSGLAFDRLVDLPPAGP